MEGGRKEGRDGGSKRGTKKKGGSKGEEKEVKRKRGKEAVSEEEEGREGGRERGRGGRELQAACRNRPHTRQEKHARVTDHRRPAAATLLPTIRHLHPADRGMPTVKAHRGMHDVGGHQP